jgi:hypothetical protein
MMYDIILAGQGWDGMGWDGMEWNGMKWNEMEKGSTIYLGFRYGRSSGPQHRFTNT